MREITQTIYKFEELNKEIQEKLIKKEMEYQREAYYECFLVEDMEEKAKELLKEYFKDKASFTAVLYDLSYCQGDGAMVTFTLEYYGKYIEIKHNGHYCHERSFTITYPSGDYLTDKQEEKLREKIIKMNEELTKYGYELVENPISYEFVLERLNEYEYFANGEVY